MNPELYKRMKALQKIDELKKRALELVEETEKSQTAKKSKATYKQQEIEYLEENFQTFADVYRLMLLKSGENIE